MPLMNLLNLSNVTGQGTLSDMLAIAMVSLTCRITVLFESPGNAIDTEVTFFVSLQSQ